jgi:hypothetical protein
MYTGTPAQLAVNVIERNQRRAADADSDSVVDTTVCLSVCLPVAQQHTRAHSGNACARVVVGAASSISP